MVVNYDIPNQVTSPVFLLMERRFSIGGKTSFYYYEHVFLLIECDVCARGLDIPNVALVVNYDMPNQVTAVDLRAWFHHTISGSTLHVSVFKRKIMKKMMMKIRIQAPRSFYK